MLRALPRLDAPNWPALAAAALLGATLVGLGLDIALWAGQRFEPPPVSFIQGQLIFVVEMFFALAYAMMGWLLAARLPRNPLGWLFQLVGLAMAYQMTATFAVQQAHEVFRPLDGAVLFAAWLASSAHVPLTVTLLVVVFLRFPTGRRLTPRWRGIGRVTALGGLLIAVGVGLDPSGLIWFPTLHNPFAAPLTAAPVLDLMVVVGVLLVAGGTVASTASMVVRYGRADPVQRAQLRWIAAAVVVLAAGGLPFVVGRYTLAMDFRSGELLLSLALTAGCFLPVAAAVAVLRHRLYDIDVIINRALVYIPLTGILGGLYTAGVAFFQRIFVALTGDRSDAAVIITTLVLASMFTPVRNTLQGFVDRRFKPSRDPEPATLPDLIPGDELKARLAELEERLAAVESEAAARRV